MKNPLTLLLLFVTSISFAQPSTDSKIVIVACKTGDLLVDGSMVAAIAADDAHQERLSPGDHYLQLKTPTEKFNLTIKVNTTANDVVKIGCAAPVQPGAAPVRILEKQLNLMGSITNTVEQNIVGLDNNDQVVLNCAVLNKKGTANVSIKNVNTQTEIYKKDGFTSIENETISIPSKGIYVINFSTPALFGKEIKFTLDRVPGPNSSPYFKTTVRRVYDTTHEMVLNTTTRVYSMTNLGHPNKTALKINLPPNTAYWAYWIGVGQEARQKMQNFAAEVAKAGPLLSADPVVLFGMKLIPSLPMLNATATVSYQFMDSRNSQLFVANQPYTYFTFKYAQNISTDYDLIGVRSPDLAIGLTNTSAAMGEDVDVKVVAFIIKARLSLDE